MSSFNLAQFFEKTMIFAAAKALEQKSERRESKRNIIIIYNS